MTVRMLFVSDASTQMREEKLLIRVIKRWIAFLMFSWGSVTIGNGGVQNAASLSAVRFLLSIFETGEQSMFVHTTHVMS